MVIKNKDGTVYKLQEPNPLTKEQEWDLLESDLVFHNFDWASETIENDASSSTLNSDFNVKDKVVSDFPEIKVEPKPEPKPEPEPEPEIVLKQPEPLKPAEPKVESSPETKAKLKNVVLMHCSPAQIRERQDDLYGDTYKSIQYGEKFTFEAVVVERNDLYMRFWTNIELSEGSVVFPSKYRDGVKFGEHRWWRVNQLVEKSGGYLTQAVVSDYHPDFS